MDILYENVGDHYAYYYLYYPEKVGYLKIIILTHTNK